MTNQHNTQIAMEIEERLKIVRAKRRLLQWQHPCPTPEISMEIAQYDAEEAELEPLPRRPSEEEMATIFLSGATVNNDVQLCQHDASSRLAGEQLESTTLNNNFPASSFQLLSDFNVRETGSQFFTDFIDWNALDSESAMDVDYGLLQTDQHASAFEHVLIPDLDGRSVSTSLQSLSPFDNTLSLSTHDGPPTAVDGITRILSGGRHDSGFAFGRKSIPALEAFRN